MKKVFAIIAIVAIVVSAAFAASEEHKIKIKADVTEVVPAFQLSYKTAVTTNNDTTADPAQPLSFADSKSYAPNSSTQDAVDTGFKLDAGGNVVVTVKIANAAKQVKPYTLTFSDGVFSVSRNGVTANQTVVPTIAATAGTAFAGTSEITASGAAITAKFNGVKATAGSTVGTATYTYAADDTIDPGTYYADILLTISAS